MLWTRTIRTRLGLLEILAGRDGLVEVVLPGCHRKNASKPRAERDPAGFLARADQQIREFLEGNRTAFSLPLTPAGTPFQLQVWEIIQAIPYRATMSYGEIAAALGNRNRARAVGGAAHANPLPLFIPCHRVVGASGHLTGFAGGLDLKQQLLTLERAQG